MSARMGATACMLLVGLALTAAGAAQDVRSGEGSSVTTASGPDVFRNYCAACHGQRARGDGPVASSLRKPPADLTLLAQRNDGTFSRETVYRIIDGRDPVAGHGGGDMPIWGDAFSRAREGASPEAVKGRIDALVVFLESIQARPVR